jgi:hypothetical protein
MSSRRPSPSPATRTLSLQPPASAIVARGSGVHRRASGSMGRPRDRQRFEGRVQAPEIVEMVEDRPRYLIGHGIGHARGRDDHGADAEGGHIRQVDRIGAGGNRRALVFLVFLVTMAGATAHAQQQQSPIENLDKPLSELAQNGYEIKAAEDLVRICRNLFSRKQKASLSARLTSQMEKKTASNLGQGAGDELEIKP